MKEKARSSGSVGWCEAHEKLLYTSRKFAREAVRRLHSRGMNVYICDQYEGVTLWHIGHLPAKVKDGTISRATIIQRIKNAKTVKAH
jgi:hypothetical protein